MQKNIAIVFPGQGSQSVGMMADLYQQFDIVRKTYDEASQVLGFDLWKLIKNDPNSRLNMTTNTQPAMLASGIACWRVLQAQYPFVPRYFAGHSLGEYTALVASEQLTFADALKLAKKRAHAMQAAVAVGEGTMAAILGLERSILETLCQKHSLASSKVWVANDNSPGQVVIAGHLSAVETVCQAAKQIGAKRAIVLPVSVPSHCPLMQAAADEMQMAFSRIAWKRPAVAVIHNYDVKAHANSQEVIDALTQQLILPVRWVDTIRFFAEQALDAVIEVGPGKVLWGLTKRIDKNMPSSAIYDINSLETAIDFLRNAE